VSMSLNRNCVPGDKNALSPGGVRIGTPAMTTRGCTSEDWKKIGEFLSRVVEICLKIQETKGKKLKDFEEGLEQNADVIGLRKEVESWARQFGYPGI